MFNGSLGDLCGEWAPADRDSFEAFAQKLLESREIALPVQKLIMRIDSVVRIMITEDSFSVGFGPYMPGSSFLQRMWHESIPLDGERHAILPLPSVQHSSSVVYWKCEERAVGRIVLQSVRPDEKGSSCTIALEPDGHTILLQYKKDALSTELRWARMTGCASSLAEMSLSEDMLLDSRNRPARSLQARAIPGKSRRRSKLNGSGIKDIDDMIYKVPAKIHMARHTRHSRRVGQVDNVNHETHSCEHGVADLWRRVRRAFNMQRSQATGGQALHCP
mmetsp:Transcript_80921/g.203583  ORF Transcript_80921/g.203583 Transcript_80921/m.203583 type:complete len:276 (-) Transcript_80921:367-1194(-)